MLIPCKKKTPNVAFSMNMYNVYELGMVLVFILFQDNANFGNNIPLPFIVCVVTLC